MNGTSPLDLVVIVIAIAVGAFIKGATGGGLPQVAIPVMAPFLGVEHAVVLMAIPGIVSNAWLVRTAPRRGTAHPRPAKPGRHQHRRRGRRHGRAEVPGRPRAVGGAGRRDRGLHRDRPGAPRVPPAAHGSPGSLRRRSACVAGGLQGLDRHLRAVAHDLSARLPAAAARVRLLTVGPVLRRCRRADHHAGRRRSLHRDAPDREPAHLDPDRAVPSGRFLGGEAAFARPRSSASPWCSWPRPRSRSCTTSSGVRRERARRTLGADGQRRTGRGAKPTRTRRCCTCCVTSWDCPARGSAAASGCAVPASCCSTAAPPRPATPRSGPSRAKTWSPSRDSAPTARCIPLQQAFLERAGGAVRLLRLRRARQRGGTACRQPDARRERRRRCTGPQPVSLRRAAPDGGCRPGRHRTAASS